jgi:hypothetical protein
MGLDVFSPVDQNGSFCFDRVIKSGKILRRVKKKGAWKASWKPAYLVLRPNLLSIYGNADETDLRESIALSDITAVARVKKSHLENVFGVFSPSKNYHFQGITEEEVLDWVTQIRLEVRPDDVDLEPLDPPAPHFSRSRDGPDTANLGTSYDTTDLSADESPEPAPGSPTARPVSNGQPGRPRGTSNVEFSGTEHQNTSHSSFSDFQPGSSLPKSGYLSTSLPKPPSTLSPIASSQQLRPPLQQRNTSQLSINASSATATAGDTAQTDPERVIRQGFISVQSTKTGIRTWKPLWTVLRPYSLSFYKNEQEYSMLKMLSTGSIIDAVEIDGLGRKREWVFEVIAEEKTLKCSVREEEDMVGWLGALKSVVERRKKDGSRAGLAGKEKEGERERALSEGVKGLSVR